MGQDRAYMILNTSYFDSIRLNYKHSVDMLLHVSTEENSVKCNLTL